MSKQPPAPLQDQWSSRLAFILAATGAAVGLGNVWRFPYMTGENGGSAFVLLYLVFVALIGLPIMIAEIIIGRRARLNPVDACKTLAVENNHSRHWGLLGWWGAFGLLLILAFYSVVAGWSIAYMIKCVSGQLHNISANQVVQQWHQFTANPWQLLLWHSLFMSLTMFVIARGVEAGLEKATKYMMPMLYVILIALVIYAGINGQFLHAAHYLFDFHIQKITTTVVIQALGHAFFTLALGAGAMLTYGAYVPQNVNVASSVIIVALLDVLVALLSGMAIFPLVFAHHLSPGSGPGLMYITLPIAFSHMHFGSLVGFLFFTLLLFAAWTSSINLAEPMIIILKRKTKLSRTKAAICIGALAWFIGIGSLLSFNIWQHVKFFHHFTVFDLTTSIPTDIILPIGGLGFTIFAGYIMSKKATREEVPGKIYPVWRFLVRYLAPIAIIVVFISSIWP